MYRAVHTLINPVKILSTGIADLIFPPACQLCETRIDRASQQICPECLNAFVLNQTEHSDFSVPGDLYIDRAWALFDYDHRVQQVIHLLKYGNRRKAVISLLTHFEVRILELLSRSNYDHILPIPLHPTKQRERGYNQVEGLASWLALRLNSQVSLKLIKRVRHTPSQTQLNAEARQANMLNAFQLGKGVKLEGDRILIVDDVVTTGATANTVAQTLKTGGAKTTDLLTLSTPSMSQA